MSFQPYAVNQPMFPQPAMMQMQQQPVQTQMYQQPMYNPTQQYVATPMPAVTAVPNLMVMDSGIHSVRHDANNCWHPAKIKCGSCSKEVHTVIDYRIGDQTVLLSLCFCFIPLCINDCKDRIHHCPQCGAYVGDCAYRMCR